MNFITLFQLRSTKYAIMKCERQIAYHNKRIARYEVLEALLWKALRALEGKR